MNTRNGLTDDEVLKSREKYGSNQITNKKKNSFLKLFIETLGDPIIRILVIALGIKLVFLMKDFDWYETVGIVVAVITLLILGIKYMMGSASEKAEYKKTMILYVVGITLLLGASAIVKALASFKII